MLAVNGLLLYGLWQVGAFQTQEPAWFRALDRAKLVALVNFGLCPFIYWHNKMPAQFYFTLMEVVLQITALLFLFQLNQVLDRLGELLPG